MEASGDSRWGLMERGGECGGDDRGGGGVGGGIEREVTTLSTIQ